MSDQTLEFFSPEYENDHIFQILLKIYNRMVDEKYRELIEALHDDPEEYLDSEYDQFMQLVYEESKNYLKKACPYNIGLE